MSVRDRTTNSWSAPAFIKLTGGTIGWQIGVQSVDLVLLVMNPKGVTELLEDRFTVGGNLSVAAGPVGRAAEASTNAQLSSQILAYSRAKGLFAGATLEGASLRADADSIDALYGSELSLTDIALRRKLSTPLPAAAEQWQAAMKRIAG
jgi:SH3 domain-containing YSC84-like protein 1